MTCRFSSLEQVLRLQYVACVFCMLSVSIRYDCNGMIYMISLVNFWKVCFPAIFGK